MSRRTYAIAGALSACAATTGWAADALDRFDAVIAAPAHHKIVLENAEVRVLQVEVAAGATEPVHEHRWHSVMHVQQPQPLLDEVYRRNGDAMIKVGERRIPGGPAPVALWFERDAPHAITNLGSEPFRALRIELKKSGEGQAEKAR